MASPRVLSLVPDGAETLCVAGGAHLMVGRGHEDDFPPAITRLPVVTASRIPFTSSAEVDAAVSAAKAQGLAEQEDGLYSIDRELIRSLRPTLILTQGLCSVCAVSYTMVERLAASLDPVPRLVTLSPVTLEDVIAGVVTVGEAAGLGESARAAAQSLSARVERARDAARLALEGKQQQQEQGASPPAGAAGEPRDPRPSVLFMEWTEPIYVGGHWTPQLIHYAGGRHPLNPPLHDGGPAGQSVKRTRDEVAASDPDWVIVCPCGLDLQTTGKELGSLVPLPWWQELRAVRENRVVLVDGNQMFNRSGPRLVDALEFLVGLLHDIPGIIPQGFPWIRILPNE